MKKTIRLVFVSVLTLVLAGLLASSVLAAEVLITGSSGDQNTYTVYDDGKLVFEGTGILDVQTSDSLPWKAHTATITSVTIPEGITAIGNGALLDLALVTQITVPDSVLTIGEHALGYTYDGTEYSKVAGFTIQAKSGSAAEDYAENNGFTFVTTSKPLPTGTFGDGLTWILSEDGQLSVTGSGAIPSYDAFEDAPWAEYNGSDDTYKITSIKIGTGITVVGKNAFKGCTSVTAVILPDGLIKIEDSAFEGLTALTEISLPDSLTTVGSSAFKNCSLLAEVAFGTGLTTLGDYAFSNTAVTSISLPNSLTALPLGCFASCDKLTTASIAAVTKISSRAFFDCKLLQTVTFASGLTEIGASAFESCVKLNFTSLPASLTTIADRAFHSCKALTKLSLPNTVTSLGVASFYGCSSLASVTIGDGITVIPVAAFEKCEALTSVTFGKNVNRISTRAFASCATLKSLTVPYTVHEIDEHAYGYFYFEDPDSTASGAYSKYTAFTPNLISHQPSAAEKYATDNAFTFTPLGTVDTDGGKITENISWSIKTATGVFLITGVGELPDYTSFSQTPWALYADYIETVVIGTGVTNVGASSFEGCKKLANITLSSTITKIGDYAFANTSLVFLSLPQKLTEIGDGAFDGCTALYSVSIPDGVVHIGQFAFRGSVGLKSLYIPESVTFIGSNAIGYTTSNTLISNFLIKGIKDSLAENYANTNGIAFRENGFIEIKHDSGCVITMPGEESNRLTLSFTTLSSYFESKLLFAGNEYALAYRLQILDRENEPFPLDGTVTVKLPIPANTNPLAVRVYHTDESGLFTEMTIEVVDQFFRFQTNTLGVFVVSNANLSELKTVTIRYHFEDGSEASPTKTFKATVGADYRFTAERVSGMTPDKTSLSGIVGNEDVELLFTYTEVAGPIITDPVDTTGPDQTTGLVTDEGKSPIVFIVLAIVILVLVLILALVFLLIVRKRQSDERREAYSRRAKKGAADRFADTIVVTDAPMKEIDIQSLFADEPEEDTDAIVEQLRKKNAENGKKK